jgi:hypothetical protein
MAFLRGFDEGTAGDPAALRDGEHDLHDIPADSRRTGRRTSRAPLLRLARGAQCEEYGKGDSFPA